MSNEIRGGDPASSDHKEAPRKVVIAGAGNLGRLLLDCLDGDDRWEVVGFIDDGLAGQNYFDLPIFSSANYDSGLASDAFMAIGYPDMRRTMIDSLEPLGLNWQTFIDRRSMVGRGVDLGRGTLVMSFAMVASGVRIGDFTYISSYAHVGTRSEVGAFSSVLFGAMVGESKIGSECILGVKSTCLDGAVIGDGASVAPYTLVRMAIPARASVAGSPPRIIRKQEPSPA